MDERIGLNRRSLASRVLSPLLPALVPALLIVSTSACVSQQSRYASLTPAERQMRQESDFFSNSNVQACLATGAAAALLAILASEQNRGRNAAIGFAAGCGIGVGVNSYVQQRRGQYRNKEQRMNAIIADVREDNRRLSRLIDTNSRVIEQDRRRIAEIDRAYQQKRIPLSEARRQLARVQDNRDHLSTTLKALKKKENDWRRVADIEQRGGANVSGLNAEIRTLRSQVDALEDQLQLMDEEIAVSPVPA